jgi:hypothetical protein
MPLRAARPVPQAFCEYAFLQEQSTIVLGGHSLWFRSFFQTFLPRQAAHDAKSKKLVNAGVVSFRLERVTVFGKERYCVDPRSVVSIFGGYE